MRQQVYKGGKQYTRKDMETLYDKADFQSWDEMIDWLEMNGRPDDDLDDAKVGEMIFDLKKVRDEGFEFTPDYKRAFDLTQM